MNFDCGKFGADGGHERQECVEGGELSPLGKGWEEEPNPTWKSWSLVFFDILRSQVWGFDEGLGVCGSLGLVFRVYDFQLRVLCHGLLLIHLRQEHPKIHVPQIPKIPCMQGVQTWLSTMATMGHS